MPFQSKVNILPAPGVAGDFASTNPFSSVLAGPGALVAPAGGLTVGNFFWVGPAGQTSQSFVSGWQIAFLGRNEQALITEFLGEFSMVVPQGFMVTGFDGGDFWAYFAGGATALAQVYADEDTGAPQMQATNTGTGSVGFTGTASFATNVMTVVTQTAGSLIEVGDVVTSATVTSGTTILAQLTGTPGAVGSTYSLSTSPGTIATQAATTASNVLNLTALTTGGFSVGDVITGTGVTTGTTIAAQLSGAAGGVGTYLLQIPGGVPFHTASETITGPANTVATGWTVGAITLTGAGVAKISANVT
jgi:hypothetical protein